MAEQQAVTRRALGLYTQFNPIHGATEGALMQAENCNIEREGVITKRRGFNTYGQTLGSTAKILSEYLDKLIVLDGTTFKHDSDGAGTWTSWTGTFSPPSSDVRVRTWEANKNLYFTSSVGPYKLDSLSGTPAPVRAGIPQGLDTRATASGTGLGWMEPDGQVGYRAVFGREDANKNLLLGAPGMREVFTNPLTTVQVAFSGINHRIAHRAQSIVAPKNVMIRAGSVVAQMMPFERVKRLPHEQLNVFARAGVVTSLSNHETPVVVVTHPNHGYSTGDTIQVSNPSDPAIVPGAYVITVIDANTYRYEVSAPIPGGTVQVGKNFNISVNVTIPAEVVAGDFLEIHRTEVSADQNTDPGDRHFKVTKKILVSGDITAKEYTFLDTFDDSFLGEDLYTNDTVETLSQANDRPPWAKFVATYKGHVFFGHVLREHQLDLQLTRQIATESITFTEVSGGGPATFTVTGGVSENAATGAFRCYTDATVATARNIRDTMKSFVRVLNRYASSFLYAHYISGPDDAPGKVLVMRRSLNAVGFKVSSSSGSENFIPDIQTERFSKDNAQSHIVGRSKHQRPEACPTNNTREVGRAGKDILGMATLRDGVLVFKEDGVFIISGETDQAGGFNFVIDELDPTYVLIAPETLVVQDNTAICLTNKGVVRFNEAGSSVISRPIENKLRPIFQFTNFSTLTHASKYESENKYILWTQEVSGDTTVKVGWAYDLALNAWTMWRKAIACGYELSTDRKLYLGHSSVTNVFKERRAFTAADHADESVAVTITATGSAVDYDGTVVDTVDLAFSYAGASLVKGAYFIQGGNEARVIGVTDLGGGNFRLTLDQNLSLPGTPFAATLEMALVATVEWAPITAGSAAMAKQFTKFEVYMEDDTALRSELGFFADTRPEVEWSGEIALPRNRAWGSAFDTTPGGDSNKGTSTPIASAVPLEHQYARAIRTFYKSRYARDPIAICQTAMDFRPISTTSQREPA